MRRSYLKQCHLYQLVHGRATGSNLRMVRPSLMSAVKVPADSCHLLLGFAKMYAAAISAPQLYPFSLRWEAYVHDTQRSHRNVACKSESLCIVWVPCIAREVRGKHLDLFLAVRRHSHFTSASNWELPLLCSLSLACTEHTCRCTLMLTLPDFTTAVQSGNETTQKSNA